VLPVHLDGANPGDRRRLPVGSDLPQDTRLLSGCDSDPGDDLVSKGPRIKELEHSS